MKNQELKCHEIFLKVEKELKEEYAKLSAYNKSKASLITQKKMN